MLGVFMFDFLYGMWDEMNCYCSVLNDRDEWWTVLYDRWGQIDSTSGNNGTLQGGSNVCCLSEVKEFCKLGIEFVNYSR